MTIPIANYEQPPAALSWGRYLHLTSRGNLVRMLPMKAPFYAPALRRSMDLLGRYLRLQVEGLENIPERGAAIIAPNHSGYLGLDALVLANEIIRSKNRVPRMMAHPFWFSNPALAEISRQFGFLPASLGNGMKGLKKNHLVVIFPEGEAGNFKPSSQAYQFQKFKSGFVRMAIRMQVPIIPTVIVGAEESHITLKQLRFFKGSREILLPLPLNLFPLPAKWRIRFLPPRELPFMEKKAEDFELIREITEDIQERMEEALIEELQKRGSAYLP